MRGFASKSCPTVERTVENFGLRFYLVTHFYFGATLLLKGDALANALMKAETKAKRRVTLSIAGLGWLDETELDTIAQAPQGVAPSEEPQAEVHPTADHISSLVEMARSCGVDLTSFGDPMRWLMQLADDTKITKSFCASR